MKNLVRGFIVFLSVSFTASCGEIQGLQTNLKDFNTEAKRSVSLMKRTNDMLEGNTTVQPSSIPNNPYEPIIEALPRDLLCGTLQGEISTGQFTLTGKNSYVRPVSIAIDYKNAAIKKIKVYLYYRDENHLIGTINGDHDEITFINVPTINSWSSGVLSTKVELEGNTVGNLTPTITVSYESLGVIKKFPPITAAKEIYRQECPDL